MVRIASRKVWLVVIATSFLVAGASAERAAWAQDAK